MSRLSPTSRPSRRESWLLEKDALERNIANKRHEAKKLKLKCISGAQELVENVSDKLVGEHDGVSWIQQRDLT